MQNKISKYFKYAIGEIVLVVIGILIALQINNWNEDKKSIKQEKTYYCKISEDLQVDIINIDSSIVSVGKRFKITKRLLKNLLKIQENKDVILKDFIATFRSYQFLPTTAAITDITSSGFSNQNIKNRILNHYTEQESALKIIEINSNKHVDKTFELEHFADVGFQEIPEYQDIFDQELQGLLASTDSHKNPNSAIFITMKEVMILNMIIGQREIELLNQIKKDAVALNDLLVPNCHSND
nr:DUF6090 family protein [Polaribacter porphyrae]